MWSVSFPLFCTGASAIDPWGSVLICAEEIAGVLFGPELIDDVLIERKVIIPGRLCPHLAHSYFGSTSMAACDSISALSSTHDHRTAMETRRS
jgi:hypothetical protein